MTISTSANIRPFASCAGISRCSSRYQEACAIRVGSISRFTSGRISETLKKSNTVPTSSRKNSPTKLSCSRFGKIMFSFCSRDLCFIHPHRLCVLKKV